MILYPQWENKDMDGDYSGMLCIPEELELPEEVAGEEDAFVHALIESMSKSMRGGTHG